MNASDIPKFGKMFWIRLIGGQRRGLISIIINRFKNQNKNYRGEPFAAYNKDYADAKAKGDKARLGIVGQPQESNSTTPDMTLTGVLYKGLLPQEADDYSGSFGWTGPNAAKVQGLSEKKNYQILGDVSVGGGNDEFLSAFEEAWVLTEIEKKLDENIKEYCKKDIVFKLGK